MGAQSAKDAVSARIEELAADADSHELIRLATALAILRGGPPGMGGPMRARFRGMGGPGPFNGPGGLDDAGDQERFEAPTPPEDRQPSGRRKRRNPE